MDIVDPTQCKHLALHPGTALAQMEATCQGCVLSNFVENLMCSPPVTGLSFLRILFAGNKKPRVTDFELPPVLSVGL